MTNIIRGEAPDDELFLFEADTALWNKLTAAAQGVRLCLKGAPQDDAVLCTPVETYTVKKQEHSSTLFVAEEGPTEHTVRCQPSHSYQAEITRPDFSGLRTTLRSSQFRLSSSGTSVGLAPAAKRRKRSDLQIETPASDAQVDAELDQLHAYEFDPPYVQTLHPDTVTEVIDAIIVQLGPHDYKTTDLRSVITPLVGIFPKSVLECVAKMFSDTSQGGILSLKKLSRYRAAQLFLVNNTWLERSLLKEWLSVMHPYPVSLSDLEGMAVQVDSPGSNEPLWKVLSRDALPLAPRKRLAELFAFQPKWRRESLVAYMEDVVPHGVTPQQYVGKMTKEYTVDGVTYCGDT